jgi:hypothetical protein
MPAPAPRRRRRSFLSQHMLEMAERSPRAYSEALRLAFLLGPPPRPRRRQSAYVVQQVRFCN